MFLPVSAVSKCPKARSEPGKSLQKFPPDYGRPIIPNVGVSLSCRLMQVSVFPRTRCKMTMNYINL